jgi:hypothetical protein
LPCSDAQETEIFYAYTQILSYFEFNYKCRTSYLRRLRIKETDFWFWGISLHLSISQKHLSLISYVIAPSTLYSPKNAFFWPSRYVFDKK